MKWTDEQQQAIDLRDRNILVSAAAGSGKTAVLVERVKELIRKDGVALEELLVVTFTNAAAAEMKAKIVAALPREAGRIHKAQISTFHAFALDIIRRYFHLIQIEPNFKICDETVGAILKEEALDRLFAESFEEDDAEFLYFLSQFAGSKNEGPVRQMILEAYEFIQALPQPLKWLEQQAEALTERGTPFVESAAFRALAAELRQDGETALSYLEQVEEMLEAAGLESLQGKAALDRGAVAEAAEALKGLEAAAGRATGDPGYRAAEAAWEACRAALDAVAYQRFAVARDERDGYEQIKEAVSFRRERTKDIIKKLRSTYMVRPLNEYLADMRATAREAACLCRLTERFQSIYREKKQQRGLLDFSDIEHYALDILAHPEAAEEYRRKFRYIFIDEYQDSNLVQETLISRIRRENNVFMVGDVKQSIYKFRLAEPEIFIRKYEEFRRGEDPYSAKIDLNRNFRSKGPIIEAVNQVFSRIMGKESAGLDYDEDAALRQGLEYGGPLNYPVEFHLADPRQSEDLDIDEEIQEMKRIQVEAAVAAELLAASRGLPIYDAKAGRERPLENRDMVVLLRSARGRAEVYCQVLEEAGIPAFADLGEGFFDTVEVSVFLNLLRVVDNRRQDVPLLSVLRSPVFGFSVEELAEIRLFRRKGAYSQAFADYGAEGPLAALKEKCAAVLVRLEGWRERGRFLPIEDLMWELLMESGYYNYVGALPFGDRRQGNLRLLADKALSFRENRGADLFGFIRYVESLQKGKVTTPQAKLLGEGDDVVRVMTVHKSKGLEFPLVLVGGLGDRFKKDGGSAVLGLHKELGLGLRRVDRAEGWYRRTLGQEAIARRRRREDMAEELRVLYVALTRAMDKLILLGSLHNAEEEAQGKSFLAATDGTAAGSYLDFLLRVAAEIGLPCQVHCREQLSLRKKDAAGRREALRQALETGFIAEAAPEPGLAAEVQRRLSWEYPYRAASATKSKFSVTELAASPGTGPTETAGTPARPAAAEALAAPRFLSEALPLTGARRGTLLHTVMEQIPFTPEGKSPEVIRAFTGSLVERELFTEEEAAAVDVRKISRFFDSDLGRRACRSEGLWRETPFTLKKERDGEDILIQGVIDCYFREDGKYVLVDYKSNYVGPEGPEALLERYRPQLALYKEALERIRGIDVAEAWLYLFAVDGAFRL